jgi:hypothetical protein
MICALVRPTIESVVIGRPEPTEKQPQGMCLDKGYDYEEVRDILHDFGFTAHIRACGEEAKEIKREAGGLRAKLRSRTSTFLDESLSPPARPLGQEASELSSVSSFCLWLDRFSCCRVIRIGTKYP